MLCVISALCLIEAQAYAGSEHFVKEYGYVKLNGMVVWQASWLGEYPNKRGVNVMIVDPSSCTLQEWRRFDTFWLRDAAAQLRNYLQGLSNGTVLVGVTGDSADQYLSDALPTLRALGADVYDVGYHGAWVFVAEKGNASKTVLDKEISEATPRQPRVNVTFGKCCLLQKQLS